MALRWGAFITDICHYSHCEAISRRWREENPDFSEVSLRQRSNMSIETDNSLLLHSSGVLCPQPVRFEEINMLRKTLHTPNLQIAFLYL